MNAKTKQANCELLASESTGSESYIRKQTPLDTKRRELAEKELINPDESRERSRKTASKRRGAVRPL
jgi:hypothetical protein